MTNLQVKFGSVSINNSPQPPRTIDSVDLQSIPNIMSGGANPPKNLGQNVGGEMRFGDISVVPDQGEKAPAQLSTPQKSDSVQQQIPTTTGSNSPGLNNINLNGSSPSNYYRNNYDHRNYRSPNNNMYGNNNMSYNSNSNGRANRQGHHYAPPSPMYNYGMYNPQYYYGAPPAMMPNFYNPAAAAVAMQNTPFSPNQHAINLDSNNNNNNSNNTVLTKPPGSPLPVRTPTTGKTPIKLTDPVTMKPLDLGKSTPVTTSSNSSTPLSVPATLASTGSPSPQPINASTHKPSVSISSQNSSAVKDQFKELIKLKLEEAKKQKAEAEKVKADAEAKTKENADSKAKEEAQAKAKEEEEAKAKEEEEAKAKEEAEAKAKEEAEAKAKEEAEAKVKEEAEAKAKEEAEAKAKEEAEAKAKEEEEAGANAKVEAETEVETEVDTEVEAKETDAAKLETDDQEEEDEEVKAAIEKERQEMEKLLSGADSTSDVSEEKIAAAIASVNDKIKSNQSNPTKLLESASRPSPKEVKALTYPSGINPPTILSDEKYRYDVAFLLQFQSVINFPPKENWDQIRSMLNFDSMGKSSFGKGTFGGRSSSVRNSGMGNPPAMGSFGSGQGLRSVSSTGAGMGSGFHMGSGKGLNRMSSSSNLSGMGGKSGRQGSSKRRTDRGSGNRPSNAAGEGEGSESPTIAAAPMPPRSANAWVPRIRQAPATDLVPTEEARLAPDVVQRKVKSLLNKMTAENFDRISDQIIEVAAQSKYEKDGRTLRQVIELTFAKAVDEQHWSKVYARFCAKMTTKVDPDIEDENIRDGKGNLVKGGALFRKYLLNRCQEEFETGWSVKLPTNPDGTPITDAELMSDEYYTAVTAKRRGLGLIRFIGEVYMLGLLSERIIHACIAKLCGSDDTSEEVIESLCQLITTVGARLDASPNPQMKQVMDAYFQQMAGIRNKPGLPSRLRFMLLDVADMRRHGWAARDGDKGPMKLQDIHEEAKAKKEAEDAAKARNRSFNRYDSRSSGNNFALAGDLSKMGRIRSSGASQSTLGPTSMLSRELSGNGRRSTSSSPGIALSKSSTNGSSSDSRTPSQNQRANIFEHLNSDDEKNEEPKEEKEEEKGREVKNDEDE